jgi:hypothetical protein
VKGCTNRFRRKEKNMIRKVLFLVGFVTAVSFGSSGDASGPVKSSRLVPNPALAGSVSPSLSSTPEGQVILSWLEPANDGQAFKFAAWNGNSWSAPKTVVRRPDFDVYAEAPPSVLKLADGSLLAVWAQKLKSGGKWDGNYLFVAASADGGKTWSSPVRVHSDASLSEHSFSSIAPTGKDRATLIWLDARDYETKHRYRLMSATVNAKGEVTDEKTIDDDTCTCCPTAFVTSSSVGIAAYRGHTPQEIRDIKVSQLSSGTWKAPHVVHDDNWHFNGCPVNGPALAIHKDRLAIVWFTGKEDVPQVEIAFSNDLGKTFQPPIVLDSLNTVGQPVGRVAVSLLDDGNALVAWLQQGPQEAAIVGQYVSAKGVQRSRFTIASGSLRELGYPRLQRTGPNVLISWSGKTGQNVQTATIQTLGH